MVVGEQARILFHLDMNSFFASVEQAYDPSLKGKPVAVAGNPKERRGIIITCSYEARAFGIYTTMPVWEAKRKCPSLLFVTPTFERYRIASQAMFAILRDYTPLVEPVSIDEGYVDVTDIVEGADAVDLARTIQDRIQRELDLPCSIGIAPNKFLAKMASGMKKPMGITILRKRDVPRVLWPLDVEEMHGVGDKTAKKLNDKGIQTIGDLARLPEKQVQAMLGQHGEKLWRRANGSDSRSVDPDSIYERKSVGNSKTLSFDETSKAALFAHIDQLSVKVADRLKEKGYVGYVVHVQVRYHDWQNKSKSRTFRESIYRKSDIARLSKQLFLELWNEEPVRLLGVTVQDLKEPGEITEQLTFDSYQQIAKEEPVRNLIEDLQKKYGKASIQRGVKFQKKTGSSSSFSKDFLNDHNRKEEE
ncbi:DNA polymerase IV [Chryseomicrobium sp. FSL W7-1435]|uniref:DNA polymerase IV n=1 Tax=Chryseomicrobium sp. FSL W7-1435 TaxID=2921704 RepID=UPI00315B0911